MDTELTADQSLVVESFSSYFRGRAPISAVRAADHTGGFDRALWQDFADLGGSVIAVPEHLGGSGGSLLDAALIGIEAGRRLAPIPFVDAVAGLSLCAQAGLHVDDLPHGCATIVAVHDPSTGAPASDTLLAVGAIADVVVMRDADRVVVAPVDAASRGEWRANLAMWPMATVALDRLRPTASRAAAPGAWDRWEAERRLLAAALLVGAGAQALSDAIDHVKNRSQFGRPIGSFQALQHRLADCAIGLEAARLLVARGASYAPDEPLGRYFASVAARAAADSAELAARESLQFFGGYGYSLEYDAHLYVRFVKAWRVVLAGDRLGWAPSWT